MNENTVECIPNISEGRNEEVIQFIAKSISDTPGVKLLHIDSSRAANRTVFTFTGNLESIFEAAFAMYQAANEKIDLRNHSGTHPRTGAVDVCPFVALDGCDENVLKEKVRDFGKRLGDELNIIGYFYEKSAGVNQRKNLANIRKGEFEGLETKLKSMHWKPDFGKVGATSIKTFGATTIGVRDFLVAYNVNLDTKDAKIAQSIAELIRELGKLMTLPDGAVNRIPGLLRSVKAIGWFVKDYDLAQVSFNLVDIDKNGLYEVFEAAKASCIRFGITTKGSELIGMIPKREMIRAGKLYAVKRKIDISDMTDREIMEIAVDELGLNEVRPFHLDKRVLEYGIENASGLVLT
ncbi:MAG: glutamate formimidoyltransferase [Cryomorphaceae bacterium]|nr:glutamate formimidoyltransferase [Cryomorphaceae bacterium]